MRASIQELNDFPKRKKIIILNTIIGIKPANLIGSQSASGQSNLSIFNSVFHLGANPSLIGFIMRPTDAVARHTYENIINTK